MRESLIDTVDFFFRRLLTLNEDGGFHPILALQKNQGICCPEVSRQNYETSSMMFPVREIGLNSFMVIMEHCILYDDANLSLISRSRFRVDR